MGRYLRKRIPTFGNGAHVIAVKKLDGSMMHINGDLIERVEDGADGKSTVYLLNGGHIIVSNDPACAKRTHISASFTPIPMPATTPSPRSRSSAT